MRRHLKLILLCIIATLLITTKLAFENNYDALLNSLSGVKHPFDSVQSAVPTPTPSENNTMIFPHLQALIEKYNNNDIVGYLKIDGTSVDYPVVQAADNNFYLDRNVHKQKSPEGAIYLDYENDISRGDRHYVLYGHNMKADTMFHALRYYNSETFYQNHRFITFDTLYEQQTWEVFAFYRTGTDFYYIQVLFDGDEDFTRLVEKMKSKSKYEIGVEVSAGDTILTLSTCTNEKDDSRYVLNAKLIR